MKQWKYLGILLAACIMLTGCISNPYKDGIKSLEAGEYSNAAEAFSLAIEKEKNLADSYRGLGIALFEQKDYSKAYEAFSQALAEGTKETATIYSLMGNCGMQMEMYEKAAEHYEKALSIKGISEELQKETAYNLIAAYEYAGDIDKAKEHLSAYIEKYPDDEMAQREAKFLETR